jgi:hypothetical protein
MRIVGCLVVTNVPFELQLTASATIGRAPLFVLAASAHQHKPENSVRENP